MKSQTRLKIGSKWENRREGVMQLLVAGCAVPDVAAAMNITPETVMNIRRLMCARAEAEIQTAMRILRRQRRSAA